MDEFACGRVDCKPSESTTWLDSLEDQSVPRRWLKISGIYIFLCYS